MARFLRLSLVVAASLALAASASANIPTPEASNVPDILTIAPDGFVSGGATGYSVNVAGPLGPVSGAIVEIEFAPGAAPNTEGLVAWCNGQTHPIVSGVANGAGDASFFIEGGGCINPADYGGGSFVAQVRADGIVLGEPGVNSPDVTNNAGQLPTDTNMATRPDGASNCDTGTNTTEVGLADAVFHTVPIAISSDEFCSNVDGNPGVGLGDGVILTVYIQGGASCSCTP